MTTAQTIVTVHTEENGSWQFEATCQLSECFPDDAGSITEAIAAIDQDGEYISGGGAATNFKIAPRHDPAPIQNRIRAPWIDPRRCGTIPRRVRQNLSRVR